MPTCSIIIRAYNEQEHIGRLLSGIRQQNVQDVQIILVDSGSTDATVSIGRDFGVEVVHIHPQEFSFGRSLNVGIQHAQSELVVIASAHVYPVYPDWLERLLTPFENERTALVYGKQRGMSESAFSEQQIFLHWFPAEMISNQNHPFCNNANAAIRRRFWTLNPYDENLPGLEDLAWAKWVQEAGYAITYAAEAEVIHVHREGWKGIFNRYRRESMAFHRIYPRETFNIRDLFRLWLVNVASDFSAAWRQKVLLRQWFNIMRFRWMQFWGTYWGYHQSGQLTWNLRRAFYYPNRFLNHAQESPRGVTPIEYHHPAEKVTHLDGSGKEGGRK